MRQFGPQVRRLLPPGVVHQDALSRLADELAAVRRVRADLADNLPVLDVATRERLPAADVLAVEQGLELRRGTLDVVPFETDEQPGRLGVGLKLVRHLALAHA